MKITQLALFAWLLSINSAFVMAQTISQPNFTFSWYAPQGFGQSFTATQTTSIQRITLPLSNNYPIGTTFTLMLFNNPADMSANISTAVPSYTQTFQKVTHLGNVCILLDTPFPVVAGQQYSFLVTNVPSAQGCAANENNPYSGGQIYTISATGAISPISVGDLVFNIWEGAVTLPSVDLGGNAASCSPLTLSAGSASSYLWSTGATSATIQVNTTNTYSVRILDATNCPAYDTVQITINTPPTVGANASNTTLCEGEDLTLTGSGANSYAWDNSVTDGLAFTPAAGTVTYSVTGTDANLCQNTATVVVTVLAAPAVVANASNTTLCEGEDLTLTGSGADSYAWDNSVTDGSAFTPAAGTVTYSVTGTDANLCQNTATVVVTVNALPAVVANASNTTLCEGEELTLTGSGANSYAWDNSVTDGSAFTPTTGTVTYSVTGTDANLCQNTATVEVTVNVLPIATTTTNNETISATLSGAAYQWIDCSNNSPIVGETNQSFTPAVSGDYAVIVTENGCSDTSDCASVVLSGLEKQTAILGAVYPNPTDGKVLIDLGGDYANVELVLTNALGQVVHQESFQQVRTIPYTIQGTSGIYLLSVRSGNEFTSIRIVKK